MEQAKRHFLTLALWAVGIGILSYVQAEDHLATANTNRDAGEPFVVSYNRDVRPILANHCFSCHGPDSGSREADLRLDHAELALESGAIVPGDSAASELVHRIRLPVDDELAMPPISSHKRLENSQVETLVRWIDSGAIYEPHWSFISPTRPAIPSVNDDTWVRNPIDHFILATLDKLRLTPATEADRYTLARRLSLGITGLPPTPDMVDRFVRDRSPDFYERYVDALLATERWGEHRGRYWLDYARYADTHGLHYDNYREMWSYRDEVIAAFNRNQPFDEFTIEQLAGDLLPASTREQTIASGFNRCNITTNEGGIIDEEYKVLYARDRTETTSTVWLGLTTGCAVCHDHKFDPISQKEFYALSAFFNNTTQSVRDGNLSDTPPVIPIPRPEESRRFVELANLIEYATVEVEKERDVAREQFNQVADKIDFKPFEEGVPTNELAFHAMLGEGASSAIASVNQGKLRLTVSPDELQWADGFTAPASLILGENSSVICKDVAIDVEFDKPFSMGAWIYLSQEKTDGCLIGKTNTSDGMRGFELRIENDRIGAQVIHSWPDDGLKLLTRDALAIGQWHHVCATYDGTGDIKGLQLWIDGKPRTDRVILGKKVTGTIANASPMRIGGHDSATVPEGVRINDVRIYERCLTSDEIPQIATGPRLSFLAQMRACKRSADQSEELFNVWLETHAPVHETKVAALTSLQSESDDIRSRGTVAHVMQEQSGTAEAFLLERGEYDQPRDRVTADVPEAFPPMSAELPKNRLGLARWIISHDHPLTARVTVNRFWQEIFGRGLVATSGDFGITGELPSHPELLDWLAVEFRDSGWDVKRLIRLMVTSATYRQAAVANSEKLAVDPLNLWLSRGPRYRMDAEMIRDYALSVSGLMSGKVGGPSVKPLQPEGVWEAVAIASSNTSTYESGEGEDLVRRSMYTFWKRSAPPASMDVFNAPSREVCTVRRERTNTPLQALVTLNDPQLIQAARVLAQSAIDQSSNDSIRLNWIVERVLCRPLQSDEEESLFNTLDRYIVHFQEHPDDASELLNGDGKTDVDEHRANRLAALMMVAHILLNLDEVLNL